MLLLTRREITKIFCYFLDIQYSFTSVNYTANFIYARSEKTVTIFTLNKSVLFLFFCLFFFAGIIAK